MYLYSDPTDDIRHPKNEAGAYEWWYFDALDPVSGFGVVIIFFDGLLFSPDYHKAVRVGSHDKAYHHPGFSLSIYDNDTTAFYSLASYATSQAQYEEPDKPVHMGNNGVLINRLDSGLIYNVIIDEPLPSGLTARGTLRFESPTQAAHDPSGDIASHHRWNLVQPNANVKGEIKLVRNTTVLKTCTFDTRGYHDHNIGMRPLDRDFDDWYWGRIHIGDKTLVWYTMGSNGNIEPTAWLLGSDGVDFTSRVAIEPGNDASISVFGLSKQRSWVVYLDESPYRIIEDHVWDNGPFYQRYRVRLVDIDHQAVDGALPGIAEYIKPGRITANWVRPMIKIRHHRSGSHGNWIQRTLSLARRTW